MTPDEYSSIPRGPDDRAHVFVSTPSLTRRLRRIRAGSAVKRCSEKLVPGPITDDETKAAPVQTIDDERESAQAQPNTRKRREREI